MTIKHLAYILNLLENAEYKAHFVYKAAHDEWQDALEIDAPNAKYLEETADELRQLWREAFDVLEAFKSKEW